MQKLSQSNFRIEITERDDSESLNDTGKLWSVTIYDLNNNVVVEPMNSYNRLDKIMREIGMELQELIEDRPY